MVTREYLSVHRSIQLRSMSFIHFRLRGGDACVGYDGLTLQWALLLMLVLIRARQSTLGVAFYPELCLATATTVTRCLPG